MREADLSVKPRRRSVVTSDGGHGATVFANLARDFTPTGPNQLWVGDITYIRTRGPFVYLAVILDAWTRRVVGHAVSRRIDARLTIAALHAALAHRQPSPGCIHHTDRGSQYGSSVYRAVRAEWWMRGSMSRLGNPYDNAQAESFIKTVKCEEACFNDYETFDDIVATCRAFSIRSTTNSDSTRRWAISARWTSRRDMLSEWPISPNSRVQLQGFTPKAEIYGCHQQRASK